MRHATLECDHPAHKAGSQASWTRYVLQNFPQLWRTIADFAQLIDSTGYDSEDERDSIDEEESNVYRQCIINLGMAHTFITLKVQ